jgi:DcuC family C4-dicarboxylate transporter
MIMLGVTKETAATAMAFACYITWGPANGFTAMYAGMGDLGMSVAEYFMRYDLWNIIVSFGLALVVFVITSKYFDRKDHCEPSPSPIENVDVSTLGCPKWYAIFPLSPIVLIVIFSKLVVGTIVISVPAAAILCWLALFLCEFFRNKDKAQVMADTMKYWKGFGDILCSVGSLIITATLFANTMTKIGALSKLFSLVGQGSGSFNIMLVIVSLAAGALSVLNGNMSGAVPLFGSIMAGICESMNVSFVVAVRTLMPITCTTTALSPISNSSLYCASITNVDIMTIVKRIAAPTITFMISTFIMTMFVLA